MSILLSLAAAFSYGLADFIGGSTAKKSGPWSVAFTAQLTAAFLVAVIALSTGGDPSTADVLWGLAAGVGNGLGTAFLYRGLAHGRMGVVAPVSGVGTALVPVIVGVALGERPSSLVWIGILCAIPAIWLVASEPGDAPAAQGSSGVMDGVLAGIGFGSLFVCLSQIHEGAGFLPLAANQLVAGLAIVAVAVSVGESFRPTRPGLPGGVVAGVLGVSATLAFLIASQGAYLSVTAVITALFPAFTVILAASILHEHIHRAQAIGLGLCGVAVSLVALG